MKFCPECGQRLIAPELKEKQRSVKRPAALTENSTVKTGPPELGQVLRRQGNNQICEGGVCDKNKSILWDEVDRLFVDGWRLTVNFLPAGETIRVRVLSTTHHEIDFTQRGVFRVGREAHGNFCSLYEFIISKVMDRQWSKLTRDIAEGRTISFDQFSVDSSEVSRKEIFGGHHTVELRRIVGCDFDSGKFAVDFIDDKGRRKRKLLGPISEIPNIHLAQAFLSSKARQNLSQ